MNIDYKIAETREEFQDGKKLFLQYAASLNIDLSFQHFEEELETIEQQYNKPGGALIIAYNSDHPIGCAGLRRIDTEIAELKRMFVLAGYTGKGIAKEMLGGIINIARELNYKKLRLDTLPDMIQAQHLYRSFGFTAITPYRFNPVEGAVFMEKEL
jgi:RimJ/RimL family protein N-acetyltransferase